MRITVITPLVEPIREAQVEPMKEKLWKSEHIVGQVASFDYDRQSLLNLYQWVWVPYWGGAHQVLVEEAYKSRFSIYPETIDV
jgi:hypothetical protein